MHGNTENLYSYFRPTPDQDRILLGSRSFDRHEPSKRSVIYLKKKLVNIFPELGACKIDYCWLGNVCFTRSQLPSIFEHDNIYYAAGFAGSGTVWARWLGKKAAELALGISNQPSMFYGAPPTKLPFYDGSPWFLPLIHRYFASKDWLKSHKKKRQQNKKFFQ
jgi:glycine/D-amino acid oxidase-like deaminating enzyme